MHCRLASLLALLVVVGIGMVMGAGAATEARPWPPLETPPLPPRLPGARSRPILRRAANLSSTEAVVNESDFNVSEIIKTNMTAHDEKGNTAKNSNVSVGQMKNTNVSMAELDIVKAGDQPIKTWEDLKSKLLNKDFLGAEAREEVIRILLPHGKRNESDGPKQVRKEDQRHREERKINYRVFAPVLSPIARTIIMATTYGVVAIMAILITFYALGRKRKGSYSQSRRASMDAPDKEELKTVKSPVTDVSRVSIAADIISARSEAAEKAQEAAARAAEQTSASQPLTPVGARVTDKMEVAEAVASKRKSRQLSSAVSGSKVFGGMPSRCKGIRPELGRSGIVLEGFRERSVPERRHSILGILRGEDFEVLPESSKSLPDIQKHCATVDENMARVLATEDMSRTILDSDDDMAATPNTLREDPTKTLSRRGSQNLPETREAVQFSSGTSWTSTDADSPHPDETTDSTSPEYQYKRKRLIEQSKSQEIKLQSRKLSGTVSKSPRTSISSQDGLERGQRPLKSQTRQYLQRSRRSTLETVQSESILSPESEVDTVTSERQSSGSMSETPRSLGGVVRSPRSSGLHDRSSSTFRQSHSSFDTMEETLSTTSIDDRVRIKKHDDRRFSETMFAVEKLVDKLTTPMVDSMRAAALSKRRVSKGSHGSTFVGDSSEESPPNSKTRRTVKNRVTKHTDDSQKPTTTDKLSESSEHKPVLPRIWDSSTELPEDEETLLKGSNPSTRATDVSSFETSKPSKEAPDSDAPESPIHRPILPRMWTSDVSDAEERTRELPERGKERLTEQSSPETRDSKDLDSIRKPRRKNIFSPHAWGIKGHKQKLDGKSTDSTNESISLEPALGEKHTDASTLGETKTVSAATSHETMSIKSISEHMSWDSNGPPSTTQGTIVFSTTSFRSVRSRPSAKLSRHKYTSDGSLKRHGNLKRPDGTHILPVSQATLQTIFSQKNDEETISELPVNGREQTKEEKDINKSNSSLNSQLSSQKKPIEYSIHSTESMTTSDKQTSVEAIENLISYNTSTTNASPFSPELPVQSNRPQKRVSSSKSNKSKK